MAEYWYLNKLWALPAALLAFFLGDREHVETNFSQELPVAAGDLVSEISEPNSDFPGRAKAGRFILSGKEEASRVFLESGAGSCRLLKLPVSN